MKEESSFDKRFIVTCIEDHTSYIPLLIKFQYKCRYQAAVHCGGVNCAYKVWYGPGEWDYEVFNDGAFERYFERNKGANA